MIKEFVGVIGGFVITIIILLCIGNYLSEISCKSKWEMSGFNSKYKFLTGCLIEISENKWIPADSYRKNADE